MKRALQVLQITDLHLKADPQAMMLDQNIQQSLDTVLNEAAKHPNWPPQIIFVTGDIVDDETPAGYRQGYQRLATRLSELLVDQAAATRICYIPGNHDDPLILQQSCVELGIQGCGAFECEDWQFVLLDSTLPNTGEGELKPSQLALLQTCLAQRTASHTLVVMHHPLIDLDSQWLDTMRIKDAEQFFAISATDGQIKGVIWGHAHQHTDRQHQQLRLLGTPATCPAQFTPLSKNYAIDSSQHPGFRWLSLAEDGSITSQVYRTGNS